MKSYHANRQKSIILRYGLYRRTEAVFQQLDTRKPERLLDLGTADGLMLLSLLNRYPNCFGIGIDSNPRLLKFAKDAALNVALADGRHQPFPANFFDAIIATAVFKHVQRLDILVEECYRVLRPGGVIIATDPTPLGIQIGIWLGHFSTESIVQRLDVQATQKLLATCGFRAVYAERFMLSPIPFSGCITIEKILQRTHITGLFFNQIVCAKKLS